MVEGARLEIVCGVYSVTEGSNPSLSAMNDAWGSSSIGRAPGSQSGGRGFDPHLLHHFSVGRARWGDSGALYPQSAIAGLNSHPEGLMLLFDRREVASIIGFCATLSF